MEPEKRKFAAKKEILFLGVVLLFLSLVMFFFPNFSFSNFFFSMEKTGDIIATVYYRSEEYTKINLTQALDGTKIEIAGDLPVVLVIENHCIRFVNAQCPDKICEHYGYIGTPGEQAVCLPARVGVRITGGQTGIDMLAD